MIIDISSYNGSIDFDKMLKDENIERVIMRGTTKNGELDKRLIENINKINATCAALDVVKPIDIYKFSYAFNYGDAATEAIELIATLKSKGLLWSIERIWLDIEPVSGRTHSMREAAQIIAAYATICAIFHVNFGIYCNYSYLKNIIPKWASIYDFWVARWNGTLGSTGDFKALLWQYTNAGKCSGISGDVDISRYVK